MITNLKIYSPRINRAIIPTVINMKPSLRAPYIIRKITGIGPVNAEINTSPSATLRGSSYNSTSFGERNIVIDLLLNPDVIGASSDRIQNSRFKLYNMFPVGEMVKITMDAGDEDFPSSMFSIFGYVESVESDMFSKDCSAQISIICPDPNFRNDSAKTSELPLKNLVQVSAIYSGTVPTGVTIKVDLEPTYEGFRILFTYYDPMGVKSVISYKQPKYTDFMTTLGFIAHFLEISMVKGKKSAILYNEDRTKQRSVLNFLGEFQDNELFRFGMPIPWFVLSAGASFKMHYEGTWDNSAAPGNPVKSATAYWDTYSEGF